MAQFKFPSPLTEGRSDKREEYALINALRRAFLVFTGGGSVFSSIIGRGDVSGDHTGNEVIVIQFELPAIYDSFDVSFACRGSDSFSTATFRLRLGGTWNMSTDGTVIASAFANSSSIVRCSGTGTVSPGNTATLMKVTMQSSAVNNTAQFGGGSLALV